MRIPKGYASTQTSSHFRKYENPDPATYTFVTDGLEAVLVAVRDLVRT
jgi:hypothetical protein